MGPKARNAGIRSLGRMGQIDGQTRANSSSCFVGSQALHRSFTDGVAKASKKAPNDSLRGALTICAHVAPAFRAGAAEKVSAARAITVRILTRWDRKQETQAFRHWAGWPIDSRQEQVAQPIMWRWSQLSLHRTLSR